MPDNMMEIRPYQDGDMAFVRQDPFQEAVKSYPELPIPQHTYTTVFDGVIVGVGGIKMYFEGVGEAWLIMTKQSKKDGIFGLIACRAIENKLNSLMAELKVRRCEANVRKDFPVALRFIEAIGFKFDGERKNWFPGNVSAMLYSRTLNV